MSKILTGGFLAGKKTHVTAVVGVITAVAAYLTGEAGLADTIQIVLTAVLGSTLRLGISASK